MPLNDYLKALHFLDDFEFDALVSLAKSSTDDILRKKLEKFIQSFEEDTPDDMREIYYNLLDYIGHATGMEQLYDRID